MLWNNLACLDSFSFKSLSWKLYGSKLDNRTFKFIIILAQIINKFTKVAKQKKLNMPKW
jgi:hypothetical protein